MNDGNAGYDWAKLREIHDVSIEEGESLDLLLAHLRDAGASPIASMKVLCAARGLSVGEAKVLVLRSPVWADALDAHQRLVADARAASTSSDGT